jgi:hypothetical protein
MRAVAKRVAVCLLGLSSIVAPSLVRAESAPACSASQVVSGMAPQQLMLLLMNSSCPFQRECAVNELSKLDWHTHADVVQILIIAAQRDSAPPVRAASVRALAYMKCDTALVEITLKACKSDVDPRVEHAAQVALEQFHPAHAAAMPAAAVPMHANEELSLQQPVEPKQPAEPKQPVEPNLSMHTYQMPAVSPAPAVATAVVPAADYYRAPQAQQAVPPVVGAMLVIRPVASTQAAAPSVNIPSRPGSYVPLSAAGEGLQQAIYAAPATSTGRPVVQPLQYIAMPAK